MLPFLRFLQKGREKRLAFAGISATIDAIEDRDRSGFWVWELEKLKQRKNHSTLRHTYYRSFLLLVVIPLILVFVVAELVIGYQIRTAAIATIDALQENIATTLRNDVRSNALQLSHFVYVNDGEFPQAAVTAHNSTGGDWYTSDQALQKAFRTAMVPSQDIVGGGFYMKDGGAVYMKEAIAVPQEVVRNSQWYTDAVASPNTVVLGAYDSSRVRLTSSIQKGNQMVLITAMATDWSTDKSGQIEVAAFYTISQVGNVMAAQSRESGRSFSVIVDAQGNVVYGDMGDEQIRTFFREHSGEFSPGSQTLPASLVNGIQGEYFFRTKAIADTPWSVITFTPERSIGQRFYEVGSALALTVAVLLLLFYLYSRYFLDSIITPIHTVCQGMARLDRSDLDVRLEPAGQQEIRELMIYFNQMVQSIQHMIAFTEQTEQKKHQAELQALQSQINPHFIVNTLNSIRFMAQVAKFDGIRKMAEALVSIVSCSFRSNVSFYTVGEELEMLKTYEYLMRIRYSNGFEVSYQVDEDCLNYQLPRLTLQPVMENAITHGFAELDEELGQIRVSVYKDEGFLCLSVWDNGRGMSAKKVHQLLNGRVRRHDDNSSIGLENVLARLRLHFGDAVKFVITSTPGAFTHIIFKLPLDACTRQEGKEERHDSGPDRG